MRQILLDKLMWHCSRELFSRVVAKLSPDDVESLLRHILQMEEVFERDRLKLRLHWQEVRAEEERAALEFAQQVKAYVPWAHPRHSHDKELASLVAAGQVRIALYAMDAVDKDPEVARTVFEGREKHQQLCAASAHWLNAVGWGWTTQQRRYGSGVLADLRARRVSVFVECGELSAPDKFLRAIACNEAVLYVPWPYDARKWADLDPLPCGVLAFFVAPLSYEFPVADIFTIQAHAHGLRRLEETDNDNRRDAGGVVAAKLGKVFGR